MLELVLATVGVGKVRSGPLGAEAERYLKQAGRVLPCAEARFAGEEALFAEAGGQAGRGGTRRGAAVVVLFDSRGQVVSSEEFAEMIRGLRDGGTQRLMLAVGPADGWSEAARGRAGRMISFGRITLPHELARLVAAEQIYRASTILAGHPYHSGH